jgi:hypothetical protein
MGDGFDRGDVRNDMKQDNEGGHGSQGAGGPGPSDMAAPGGSSGSGGYGADQNAANQQGQDPAPTPSDAHQSRGERYDELSGGGRGAESVSYDQDRDGTVEREPSGDDPV